MQIKKLFSFVYSNFGPLIVFYLVNFFWGIKFAIVFSIIFVLFEFLWLKFKNKVISDFFYFSSGTIILFGLIDLTLESSLFLIYEASVTNILTALFFLFSLKKEKSIVQDFAEAQGNTTEKQSEDKNYFFKVLTLAWAFYFLVKALIYLWINLNTTIGEGLLARFIVGKISFWIMMFVSIGLRHQIWNLLLRLNLFPSQKLKLDIK